WLAGDPADPAQLRPHRPPCPTAIASTRTTETTCGVEMDRAAPPIDNFHALELRVTAGPQRGARAPLKSGAANVIATGPDGQADDADIVLRDDKSAPVRIR